MRRDLHALEHTEFDVLIIGGGINGAGVARDLALRNAKANAKLRIALVEKHQFGSGTSGRNSHLIHGGLRYLKYFDFGLVREALRERATLLRIAPDLVEPLEFLLPFPRWRDKLLYSAGLALYDGLAGPHKIARHRTLSREELGRREPSLNVDNFDSAASFMDCGVQSARLVLENVADAVRHGVCAANYVEVANREPLRLRDRETGREFPVRANLTVDATGAWSDDPTLRLVRGSHLVFPRMHSGNSAIAYFEPSGRIIFFIPWGSSKQCTLVGTTDVDHEDGPENVHISREEIGYLTGIAKTIFRPDRVQAPIASFSSLRPLVKSGAASATSTSREHRIWRDDDGAVRIAGGKYTTYRLMSEEAADLVCQSIAPGLAAIHLTDSTPLPVARAIRPDEEGIRHAASEHMTVHLADLLFCSTTAGFERLWPESDLREIASRLGQELGWDQVRIDAETEASFVLTRPPNSEGA